MTQMSKLQEVIYRLKTDSTWQLASELPILSEALNEIDNRITNLEKKETK